MDRLLRALLVVGMLNLIVLGLIACGDDGQADASLADRVAELEAWKLGVEQRLVASHNFAVSQSELNRTIEGFMQSARDHALAMDETLQSHAQVLTRFGDFVKDILKAQPRPGK